MDSLIFKMLKEFSSSNSGARHFSANDRVEKPLEDKTMHSVIVLFKHNLAGSPYDVCKTLNYDQNILPDYIYHTSIKGFASVMESSKLNYLASRPHVLRIEIDHQVKMWP